MRQLDSGIQAGMALVYYDAGDLKPGWYWVECYPGEEPSGKPCGPFTTARTAWQDVTGCGSWAM